MPHEIPDRPTHSRLIVVRAEHELADLGQHDRPRALRAGLERDVEGAIVQSVGAEGLDSTLNREQLGVRGGVAAMYRLVVCLRDHTTVPHHDRPDGNLV